MEKIKMQNPIVEIDGDEMTRILWSMIKEELILPFVELNTEYYDLCLPNRDKTDDQITVQAAEAIKVHHVGAKCATITPNLRLISRQDEYGLKQLWKSPNATIRAALDGTVFRAPILISKVKPVVSCWKKPITIARHAYGDIYKAVEYRVPGAGKAEMIFTDENGKELSRQTIFDFKGPGVIQGKTKLYLRVNSIDDPAVAYLRKVLIMFPGKGQIVFYAQDPEMIALAKENGMELTEESAKAYFEQLNPKTGEVSDDELNNVAGGGCLPWADDPYDTCMADGYCLSDYVCSRCGKRGIDFSTGVLRCSGCFASDPRCRNCMNSIGDKSDTVLKCKVHPRPC